jgi:hypothetical protein
MLSLGVNGQKLEFENLSEKFTADLSFVKWIPDVGRFGRGHDGRRRRRFLSLLGANVIKVFQSKPRIYIPMDAQRCVHIATSFYNT